MSNEKRTYSTRKKKQQAMLDAFGDRYAVLEHNGGYLVYDKERQAKYAYIGKFYLSTDDGGYVYHEDRYSTVESLVSAMDAYNATLPFSSEIYDPVYRKHVMIEYALHDYLISLGLEFQWGRGDGKWSVYLLKDTYRETICEIAFMVNEDTTTGTVMRALRGDKWVESSFTDLDSAVGAVNSILAASLSMINAKVSGVLSAMTASRSSEILNKTFDVRQMSTFVEDGKAKAIEYLEKELRALKG